MQQPNKMNMLMCVDIACLFKYALRFAWVRSAGTMGVDMYSAVTQRGASVVWMELDYSSSGEEESTHNNNEEEEKEKNVQQGGGSDEDYCGVGGSDRCVRFPIHNLPHHHTCTQNIAYFNKCKNSLYGISSSFSASKAMETLVLCGKVSHRTFSDTDMDMDDELFIGCIPLSGGGGWGSPDEETTSFNYHLKFTYFQDLDVRAEELARAFRPSTVEFDRNTCTSPAAPSHKSPHQLATTVNNKYFSQMPFLTKITLSPQLQSVAHIPTNFLSKCTRITEIDLSVLRNVTHIGEMFLAFCSSLTSLDVSPLKNVVQVGKFFLSGCSSIKTLDLTPMEKALEIEELSIYACKNLTVVLVPKHLQHRVRALGNDSCKIVGN